MKTVFIGASTFGLRALGLLRTLDAIELVGVVTAPQKFRISYRPEGVTNVLHADMAAYCSDVSIPCVELTTSMKDEHLFNQVQEWKPDMFIVVGWYHMIPAAWRQLAPCYGLHASLLPDYSGGAPLVWAMINGESRTGISFFQMDDGVDSGPLVGQRAVPILETDTIRSLYDRIEAAGLELLGTYVPRLASGEAEHILQDESKRRIFPQRGPEDGAIDWACSVADVDRFIRAQTKPYPGAFFHLGDSRITVWKASPVSDGESVVSGPTSNHNGIVPGTLKFSDRGAVSIRCGDGWMRLRSISVSGLDMSESDLEVWFKQAVNTDN